MATTEHTINDAIADLLSQTRHAWRGDGVVVSESTGQFAESSMLQPDIVVKELWIPPVVIETEVMPASTVEADARSRLGYELSSTGYKVSSVVAVRVPERFREAGRRQLKRQLRNASDLQFALLSGETGDKYDRYPLQGWLDGGINDLSLLIQSATIPPALVDRAANWLELGINQAAQHLKAIAETHPTAVQRIADELHQQDSIQTRRMAMAILINAFMFHAHLARSHGELGNVRNLAELEFTDAGGLQIPDILHDWRIILSVNYWPIFDIASRILRTIPNFKDNQFITQLVRTAEDLLFSNLMRSHDLTGTVFQKLIADRKFLAAFYTKPASAALLVGLAISGDNLLSEKEWGDEDAVASLRIADFACGTGTLLSTVYQRLSQLHELHGGNTESIHAKMMARTLVGCDILPAAAHLTASMLASAHPQIQYDESAIFTAPYGIQPDGKVKLGSIDLLRDMPLLEGSAITAKALEATQGADVDIWRYAPHGSFDMVIMNPPFTRPTNHERRIPDTPNPMFAAFSASADEQMAMSNATQQLTQGNTAWGNSGEASIFLALADRKLKVDGMLALVMPLTLLTGSAWETARTLLANNYGDLIIASIAGSAGTSTSFSADTGMGECLVVGRRTEKPESRATFVTFLDRPKYTIQGRTLARAIRDLVSSDGLRKLEAGPTGGTAIYSGDTVVGNAIDAPLPSAGTWKIIRIRDLSLAQCAYQLASKQSVWLPGMSRENAVSFPITSVGQIGLVGPYSLDVSKKYPNGKIRGPFELRPLLPDHVPTYPILWAHHAPRERTMTFEADREGIPFQTSSDDQRKLVEEKTAKVFATASHCHHNVDFRFNSQSTSMQFTSRKTIGGRAWLSVQLENAALEKALVVWANSTLGILMYWWHASKQQPGRGSIPKVALHSLPILDITALSPDQLESAARVFDETCQLPLKPLHELHLDDNRNLLDRRFYSEVLGLPDSLLADNGPLDILRTKLSQEPSIRGGKK